MKKSPAWLTYAAKIKSQIRRLPPRQQSKEARERIILKSHFTARSTHAYPGSLIDWDYIVANIEKRCGVASSNLPRRKK